jgi:hypothetical protein
MCSMELIWREQVSVIVLSCNRPSDDRGGTLIATARACVVAIFFLCAQVPTPCALTPPVFSPVVGRHFGAEAMRCAAARLGPLSFDAEETAWPRVHTYPERRAERGPLIPSVVLRSPFRLYNLSRGSMSEFQLQNGLMEFCATRSQREQTESRIL